MFLWVPENPANAPLKQGVTKSRLDNNGILRLRYCVPRAYGPGIEASGEDSFW